MSFKTFTQKLSRRRSLRRQTGRKRNRLATAAAISLERLEDRRLLSASPSLVKDINLDTMSSGASVPVEIGSTMYFAADDGVSGRELWKSDGTEAGTGMVADIHAGSGSSYPGNLTNVNGTLYFTAGDAANGYELWKSDGTEAGTVMVADIYAGSGSSSPYDLTNVNGTLYFRANDGVNGRELWKSDGTEAGTEMIADIRAGSYGSSPRDLTNVNGTLYFKAYNGANGYELWKSDGTEAGTGMVADIYAGSGSSSPSYLTNVNGTLYFKANDGVNGRELWKSDGTEAGTVMIADIYAGSGSSSPSHLTNVDGTLYFTARDGVNGGELWKSDGTEAGTGMVADIRAGRYGSSPRDLTNVDGTLYFRARDGANGDELWKSDGTEAGTVMIADIYAGSYGSRPDYLTNVNGTLYFTARDGVNGWELWKSDGTEAGTGMVADIYAGSYGSSPHRLTNVNGRLYFTARDGVNGWELWKSDGTEAGTVMVADINQDTASSMARYDGFHDDQPRLRGPEPVQIGSTLYFVADDGVSGRELWKSDGTEAGTVMVADIYAGSYGSSPYDLTNVNGTLYFTAYDGVNGSELWKSDGTEAGTGMVADIRAGSYGSSPRDLTNVDGTLYFRARDGANGWELWKSDGTEAGTGMVADIRAGSGSSYPGDLMNVDGTLYFRARDGVNGSELWKSDGSEAGTVMVADVRTGSYGSSPGDLTNVDGTLYFTARDGVSGYELWKSDGTEAGTGMVADIRAGSDGAFTFSTSWWLSRRVDPELTAINGTLYFKANDGENGWELWKTDGTPSGTVIVADLRTDDPHGWNSGSLPESSFPLGLTAVDNTLFFAANDGSSGWELWKLETAATPASLQDVVNSLDPGTTTQVEAPASPTDVNDWIDAIAALAPRTDGETIDIVLNMEQGTYGLGRDVSVPEGYRLVIDGAAGQVIFEGSSPALTVSSGDVLVKNGVTFTNTTDAPSVLVHGGHLTVRGSTIQETTGGDQAAIEITGGTVDLGTAADPGGNTFEVRGAGEAVHNITASDIPALGNVFQVNGTDVSDPFAIEQQVHHALDVAGLGLVSFVAGNVDPRATIDSVPAGLAEGAAASFSASFADVGSVESHTAAWTIHSSETGATVSVPGVVDEHLSSGSVTLEHVFSDPGVYTLALAVTDEAGAVGRDSVELTVLNVVDIHGHVFDDLANDGQLDTLQGDAGIDGVSVELVDETTGSVVQTAITDSSGAYGFQNLAEGTYTIRQQSQPVGYLDGKESVGDLDGDASIAEGTVDNGADSNAITGITIGAPGTQNDSGGYSFAELRGASLQGLVWEDFNDDAGVDMGEIAIQSVTVELSGTDDRGNAVSATQTTDAQGIYEFGDLRPGVYSVQEIQPSGFTDGQESLGEVLEPAPAPLSGTDGSIDSAGDMFSGVELVAGSFGVNYNFGERVDGGEVAAGQAAAIGFWQNKKGQELIESLNGSSESTLLAGWMADTFPNMYGNLPDRDGDGDVDNSDVASTYKQLFKRNGRTSPGGPPKLDAQVMAVALASFLTKESLAGLIYDDASSAGFQFEDANGDGIYRLADGDSAVIDSNLITQVESYGFDVTTGGLGSAKFNVGDSGEAFGVGDGDSVRIVDLLLATDSRSHNGLLYDANGDGSIGDDEELLRVLANDVYSGINEQGDI